MIRTLLLAAAATTALGGAAEAKCNRKALDAKAAGPGCARAWMDANLRLNDVAVIGTHNSYHGRIPPKAMALIEKMSKAGYTLDYAHEPMPEQLDKGVRQLEIDVAYDPKGGLYLHPQILAATGESFTPERLADLAKPGFKAMHVPDVDVWPNCVLFTSCLAGLKAWSDRHPDHTPILVIMNMEQSKPRPGGVAPLPFDAAAFAALEAEIRGVMGSKLITPDEVRGRYPTLRDAVLAGDGWPKLGKARGRFLFAIDERPDVVNVYMGEHTALQGKALFVNSEEAWPSAAYLTLNDPVKQRDRIAAAVKAGFLVRTRADADTKEARSGDTTSRDTAIGGGAQAVSTDYLEPDVRFGTSYFTPLRHTETGLSAAAICDPLRPAGAVCGPACGGRPALIIPVRRGARGCGRVTARGSKTMGRPNRTTARWDTIGRPSRRSCRRRSLRCGRSAAQR